MKVTKRVGYATALLVTMAAPPLMAERHKHQNGGYYDGLRQGSRGGYDDQDDHWRYDSRNEYNRAHGGTGPGGGALIGGAGGAALGTIFGGGLKGALIGGGAGAGVGAIVGKLHQENKHNDWRDSRNNR